MPRIDGGLIPVFEVMTITPAVQNLIREGKTHQINNVIFGGAVGNSMLSMDNELARLCREGVISRENALLYTSNMELMKRKI